MVLGIIQELHVLGGHELGADGIGWYFLLGENASFFLFVFVFTVFNCSKMANLGLRMDCNNSLNMLTPL